MKNKKLKKLKNSKYTLKGLQLLILLILMVLPFTMQEINLLNSSKIPELLYPYSIFISFFDITQKGFSFFYINCLALLILPISFITITVSFFVNKITDKIINLLVFISITIYLSATISGIIIFANGIRWFKILNISVYFTLFITLALHISLITKKILSIKAENESYTEYKNLLLEEEKKQKNLRKHKIKLLKTKLESIENDEKNKLAKEKYINGYINKLELSKKRFHIKTKITLAFLAMILLILSNIAYVDLKNSKMLFTQTINNTCKNQAEQVAAIYYFSDGLHKKIGAFLEGIKKTNLSSPFPFERVDIITTSHKEPVFLEKINSPADLPIFDVFSYTTAVGEVDKIPSEEKQITAENAALYIKHLKNERTKDHGIYKAEKGTYLYVHPITFKRKEGNRLSGFSIITYSSEILNRPYFQTKVFVISISIVFLYISIIIVLFLSDFIADPIIALCGSIRKTTNILSEMLSGNAKIEASRLSFDENVKTNDEIKSLSIEIKNIVSLTRGILPYVSFHTIQNAEKNRNLTASTRNLCFLFTDIRGFTSLCENLSAKDVIPILNHYLDLETKIIFENGGDVDKYVGDAMMAFFSGPNKELRACKAAMEIRWAMEKERQTAINEGTEPISIGIGISSGPVVFGSVGAKTRKDFTSIGDTVNLASRLESANKAYGSKTVISENVYEKIETKFICRELDYVTVKGKNEPVRIYELLQSKKLSSEAIEGIKKLYEAGLYYYRKKKWTSAEKYFSACSKKYNDTPSKAFLKRIAHYKISPPDQDWQGVFVMNVK